MNILDIIVLALIAFFCIRGAFRGLILSVVDMASFIVAGFCASKFYPMGSKILMQTGVDEWLQKGALNAMANNQAAVQTTSMQASQKTASAVVDSLQIPAPLKPLVLSQTQGQDFLHLDKLFQSLSGSITQLAVNILSIIIIFFGVKIGLFIIAKMLDAVVKKLPIISGVNKIGGSALGALNGIIIIFVLCAVLTFAAPVQAFAPVQEQIKQSTITKQFYTNNLLLQFILKDRQVKSN